MKVSMTGVQSSGDTIISPIIKQWTCSNCSRLEDAPANTDPASKWWCQRSGREQIRCKCRGTNAGHTRHKKGICWKPCTCSGVMSFCPSATSCFGGGLKCIKWSLDDPEIQHRFEGQCCQCQKHADFNDIRQRCSCGGVRVVQVDHMPAERRRRFKRWTRRPR